MLQPLYSGPAFLVYTFAGLQVLCSLAASLTWIVTMQGQSHFSFQFASTCSLIASICNLIWTVFLCGVYYTRSEYSALCALNAPGKWAFRIALGTQFAGFGCLLVSLSELQWVQGQDWTGGLFRCFDCPYQTERVGWDCFTGVLCTDNTPQTALCEVFSVLRDAGHSVLSM